MAINLLDIAREHLTDGALKLIANKVGIDPNNIQETVGKVFPSLLASFGERAKSEEGAGLLLDTVKNTDSGFLDNLTGTLSGDTSSLQESGTNILGGLFGDNASSIVSQLGKFAGLSEGKAGGLLSLLTPVLTGILGKQVSSGGLGISGLQSLMKDQEAPIKGLLGDGFMSKLGLGGLTAGIGAGLANAGSGISGVGSKVSGAASAAGDKVSGAVGSVGGKVSGAVGSAGSKVSGAVGSAGGKVSGAVGSAGSKVSGAVGAAGSTVAGAGSKAAGAVGSAASSASSGGGGFLKFLPLLLIPIIGFFLLKKCKGGADLGAGLKDATGSLTEGAKNLGGAAVDGVKAVGEGAADLGGAAVDGVKSAGEAVGDGVKAVGEGAADLGGAAVDGVKSAGEAVGDGVKAVGEGAADLGGAAVDGVKSAGEAVGDGVKAVGEGAANLGGAAIDGVKDAGEAVAEALTEETPTTEEPTEEEAPATEEPAKEDGMAPLSDNVKNFTEKLAAVDASDEAALTKVYDELSADGSSKFLYRIPFQTGETGVPTPHQEALIAKLKTASPDATLVTIGYADVRGDDALNKRLSLGRAEEVSAWIKNTLGGSTNLESFSMGETDRFSKSDYSKNRVVEVWQVAK